MNDMYDPFASVLKGYQGHLNFTLDNSLQVFCLKQALRDYSLEAKSDFLQSRSEHLCWCLRLYIVAEYWKFLKSL